MDFTAVAASGNPNSALPVPTDRTASNEPLPGLTVTSSPPSPYQPFSFATWNGAW